MSTISLLLALCSCVGTPCLDNDITLKGVTVINGGYIWNCGRKAWEAEENELSKICDFLRSLTEINPVSVRVSHWRLDIYLNDEDKKLIRNNFELFHTEHNGYVFRKGQKYFSNDDFADYLIKSLGITNSDPSPCE